MSCGQRLSWETLVQLEPRLAPLPEEAKADHAAAGPDFCAADTFAGFGNPRHGIKARLRRLVAWDFAKGGILGTSGAFEVCHDALFRALPPCRGGCGCTVLGGG
jgi:hypothetical protein